MPAITKLMPTLQENIVFLIVVLHILSTPQIVFASIYVLNHIIEILQHSDAYFTVLLLHIHIIRLLMEQIVIVQETVQTDSLDLIYLFHVLNSALLHLPLTLMFRVETVFKYVLQVLIFMLIYKQETV